MHEQEQLSQPERCVPYAGIDATMRSVYVVAPLLALLAAALWFMASSWTHLGGGDFPPIPVWGWFAIAGGVLFSLALGVGLMCLMFYSSRHGYDEAGDDPR
jgi:hypothetical protein